MCIQMYMYMCTHMVSCHTLSLVVWVAHMTSLSLSLSLSAGILTMRCGISGTAQRS